MLGAFLGDFIGSVYEWENTAAADFPIPDCREHVTDDSVMTAAVASTLLKCRLLWKGEKGISLLQSVLVKEMVRWYHLFPNAGYGQGFQKWLEGKSGFAPYHSYGNGAGMRISPVGWAAESLDEVAVLSDACTAVSHDHPEGLRGARAIATAVFLARKGASKEMLKRRLSLEYPSLSDIDGFLSERPRKRDFSCQKTVPLAIACFLKSDDEENAIRLAISQGGDSDTIACMAGAVSEAFYCRGELTPFESGLYSRLPEPMREVIAAFHSGFHTEREKAF